MSDLQIRTSWSMLSAWSHERYQDAIAMLLRQPTVATDAMLEGKRLHEIWELEGRKTGCLPETFGGQKLNQPKFEIKKEIRLNSWIVFVGVLDVLDLPRGVDYKSGSTPATAYANSLQHCCYQVLYPNLKSFEYHVYNTATKRASMVMIHLDDNTLRRGVEFILSNASEIRAYCEQNDIVPVNPLQR